MSSKTRDSAGYNIHLIAREKECALFAQLESSAKSEFVAIYGRRRVGKTYLVREFFKRRSGFFEFSGTKDLSLNAQIKNYIVEFERLTQTRVTETPGNWTDALRLLSDWIESNKRKHKEKIVIFFDELPWLASKKSGFLPALDYFWNSFVSKRKDVLLFVCGSAANWMISHIVNDKGGFHNRLTRPPIALPPFSLQETREYLLSKQARLNLEQIAEIYFVTGGVAHYLDQYEKGESAAQFINRCFFSLDGPLRGEFDRLYRSLFDSFETHVEVVRTLARHPFGRSYAELTADLKQPSGGSFTQILNELEKSHFIGFSPQLGHKKKDGIFHLTDELSIFYLNWVESLGRTFQDADYWKKQVGKPRYYQWLGHAFESLCWKNVEQIRKKLGISGLTTSVYAFRNATVQIDLIIDRSDKVINLCEMKYTADPYEMSADEAKKLLLRKKELLKNLKRKKQVFITLVTPLPAKRNSHYLSVVDQEVNLEAFF